MLRKGYRTNLGALFKNVVVVEGHVSTGHLSNSSIKKAKVAIEMVIVSSNFSKNLWFTFVLMLNDFYFFHLMKGRVKLSYNSAKLSGRGEMY